MTKKQWRKKIANRLACILGSYDPENDDAHSDLELMKYSEDSEFCEKPFDSVEEVQEWRKMRKLRWEQFAELVNVMYECFENSESTIELFENLHEELALWDLS